MILVYSTSWCPSCLMVKRLLEEKNISYKEINIEKEGWDREKLQKITGAMTVPQIVINDKCIGGFEALMNHDQNYDVVSGVMNVDLTDNKDNLAITDGIPNENPKGRIFNWIGRKEYSELIKVDWIGFSFTRISRKAVKELPFREDSSGYSQDVMFAIDCKNKNIPIYADTGIFFKHLRYQGELMVGKKEKSCRLEKWSK